MTKLTSYRPTHISCIFTEHTYSTWRRIEGIQHWLRFNHTAYLLKSWLLLLACRLFCCSFKRVHSFWLLCIDTSFTHVCNQSDVAVHSSTVWDYYYSIGDRLNWQRLYLAYYLYLSIHQSGLSQLHSSCVHHLSQYHQLKDQCYTSSKHTTNQNEHT